MTFILATRTNADGYEIRLIVQHRGDEHRYTVRWYNADLMVKAYTWSYDLYEAVLRFLLD